MLDQNTDRMWYVIGAVLIGAAIIFGFNFMAPNAFASVSGLFDETLGATRKSVQAFQNPNVFYPEYPTIENAQDWTYDPDEQSWRIVVEPSTTDPLNITRVFKHDAGEILVPYGESYTFSFEIRTSIDIPLRLDTNNRPLDAQGLRGTTWSSNNHDNLDKRNVSGYTRERNPELSQTSVKSDYLPIIPLEKDTWETMWMSYTNDSLENIEKYSLQDFSNIGFLTENQNEPFVVEIRKVKGEFADTRTPWLSPYETESNENGV